MYDDNKNKDDLFRRMRAGDGPSWRWHRAGDLLEQSRQPDPLDDAATVAAWRFRAGLPAVPVVGNPITPVPVDSRVVSAAHDIHIENGPRRWEIEGRLLTGVTPAEIAERLKVDTDIIDAFTGTFFDIVGRTNSIGWLGIHLPVAISTPPSPTEAQIWMHIAASGDGAKAALNVLIADYLERPEPAIPDRHQVAEDIRSLVRFTCTPPTPTPAYRRLLNRMWWILATRVTIRDPKEWDAMVQHMDVLEMAAGETAQRQPGTGTASGVGAVRSRAEAEAASDLGANPGGGAVKEPSGPDGDSNEDVPETGSETTGPFPMLTPDDALFGAERGLLCWSLWSPMVGLAVA